MFFFARARTFKALEVNFLAHICFKSVGINVQLMKFRLITSKKSDFFTKSERAYLLRFVQNHKMHAIYIILSSHANKSASYDNAKLCLFIV